MSKILKNNTQSNINIADCGVTINSNSQYTIPSQDYLLWAASSNIITKIGSGDVIVNDGTSDLSISEGTDFIKGIFSKKLIGGTDGTTIGNVTDRLKVDAIIELPKRQQDAFGNMIHVEPNVIFSTHFSNSDHAKFLWNKRETTGGTVTHTPSVSSMVLATTTSNGSKAEYQTFRSVQYIPGQALEYISTQVFTAPKTNLVQRVGMRDDDFSDGIYWEVDSTGINAVVKGTITEKVARANWYDPVDGTGPSGLNLDFTKGQILIIHYQWLGYGDVEFGIQVGTDFVKVHTIEHHGSLTQPYTHAPSFNGFAEIENTGVTESTSSMKLGCFSVKAFGNAVVGNSMVPASNEGTLVSVGSSVYVPIIAVRFNSSATSAEAILEKINMFSSSATDLHYKILFNATITGGSWVDIGNNLQKNVTVSSFSGGHEFYADYLQKQSGVNVSDIGTFTRLGRFIDGSSNTVVVVAKSLGGNVNTGAALIFKELF